MKMNVKAGLLALSIILGATAVVAVGPGNTALAKQSKKDSKQDSKKDSGKKDSGKKLDKAGLNKKLAELDKTQQGIKKHQKQLLAQIEAAKANLIKQYAALESAPPAQDPAAPTDGTTPATDPAASPSPEPSSSPSAEPSTPPSTDPSPSPSADPSPAPTGDPTSPPADSGPFAGLLSKFANGDASLQTRLSADQITTLSSLAADLTANETKAAKYNEDFAKLETSYKDSVKQAKYTEALKIRNQMVELDKLLNKAYTSMLTDLKKMTNIVKSALDSSNDDDDNDGEHENHDLHEHDDD